jgi:hypothetical protein
MEKKNLAEVSNEELLENFAWSCISGIKFTPIASFEE